MKRTISTILTVLLYCVLVLVASVMWIIWLLFIMWNDILRYYSNGFLEVVYGVIAILGIVLPIVIFAKNKKRWILPAVLSISMVFSFFVCCKINDYVEDSFRTFSVEKWGKYEYLRSYMLEDLQNRFTFEGATEESVLELLGEPTFVGEFDGKKALKYHVAATLIDAIVFYIVIEDGIVVETGKYQS